MKKSTRIQALVASLEPGPTDDSLALHPCYTGWFTCFNAGQYYEAHDVLEHLWLETPGENHRFFKGLIQLAGAFVHLRKQFERPEHPKDGRRLHPAARLFQLAARNLEPFVPRHLHLDVQAVLQLCARHVEQIETAHFAKNPWCPERMPRVELEA